jgi:uncharacterized membrane protein
MSAACSRVHARRSSHGKARVDRGAFLRRGAARCRSFAAVVFMGTINVFFYLDKRKIVLLLVGGFVASNVVFTAITLSLNPTYYGYGFATSLLVVVLASLYLLDRKLDSLEYETFMLQ